MDEGWRDEEQSEQGAQLLKMVCKRTGEGAKANVLYFIYRSIVLIILIVTL